MSRENIDYEGIRERLLITRKTLKLSQAMFGKRVGMLRQDVHAIEKGIRQPGIKVLFRISNEYGLTLDWLVKGTSKEF